MKKGKKQKLHSAFILSPAITEAVSPKQRLAPPSVARGNHTQHHSVRRHGFEARRVSAHL